MLGSLLSRIVCADYAILGWPAARASKGFEKNCAIEEHRIGLGILVATENDCYPTQSSFDSYHGTQSPSRYFVSSSTINPRVLSTVRRPALEPVAVASLEALKLRRIPSQIASSNEDLPLLEAAIELERVRGRQRCVVVQRVPSVSIHHVSDIQDMTRAGKPASVSRAGILIAVQLTPLPTATSKLMILVMVAVTGLAGSDGSIAR